MTETGKRDWGEWGRYTISAIAGAAVAIVTITLWFSDVKHVAADAKAVNDKQDDAIEKLATISGDVRLALARLIALQEAHEARIRALEVGR